MGIGETAGVGVGIGVGQGVASLAGTGKVGRDTGRVATPAGVVDTTPGASGD
ncbi:MAG: hypothetical protein Kow0063_32340 [Anaerolineae bacterium]